MSKKVQSKRAAANYSDWKDEELKRLISFPFPCPNCDQSIYCAQLYCSPLCKQEAKYVRYVRSCIKGNRYHRPDIQMAIQTKLAMILGGGYPEQERTLPPEVRQAVIERDSGKCVLCGSVGIEIDHINSSSNDLENLQLLCKECHEQKTRSSFTKITRTSHPELWEKAEKLNARCYTPSSVRLCDTGDWNSLWRTIDSARRKIVQ